MAAEDAILLLGDGVYAALPGSAYLAQLADSGAFIHALRPDALAAGLSDPGAGVELIDMAGFVALTERYPRQVAWF